MDTQLELVKLEAWQLFVFRRLVNSSRTECGWHGDYLRVEQSFYHNVLVARPVLEGSSKLADEVEIPGLKR